MALGLGLALVAAVAYAVAYVAQYREASRTEADDEGRGGLLGTLVRRPLWLAGVGTLVVGSLAQTAALGSASLGLVEPVLMATLLFALPLGAVLSHQRLTTGEWIAAVMVSAGVGLLVAGAGSRKVEVVGATVPWTIALAVVSVVVGGVLGVVRALDRRTQAVVFACVSGALWGVSDALTKSAFRITDHAGFLAIARSWQPYVLVAMSLAALATAQYGYQRAPLPASLPGLVIAEPVVGVVIGAAVLHTHFRLDLPWCVLEAVGAIAAVAGTYL
ncbi:MAG TPA: DMT family transporter, partial [Acidimicrobiales bacterium]|nr:DMT family transporter [Acidimicrobiales bacterium]